MMIAPSGVAKKCVRTQTCHVYLRRRVLRIALDARGTRDVMCSLVKSPKSVFAHEHITCTSGVERDTQDTALEETRRKRDTQDNSPSAFEIRNPTGPGWNPSGRTVAMGCPRS